MKRQLIRLEIAGQLQHRDIALRTVSAACRLAFGRRTDPAPQRVLEQMVSAVGEAFNNIAVHGYRDRPAGVVEIRIAVSPRRLSVELRDYGLSFDPRTAAPPDLESLPESGLGVYIMARSVDRIEYRPGRPNVLRLVKHLA